MFGLAARLRATHGVYLLSNVGELHWERLRSAYRIHEVGHDAIASYLTGFMKPDPAIYLEAERRFGLDPARTVFIDDRAENVAAARARGWHAVRHSDPEATFGALRALGIGAD